jgi:hypothetical protein
MLQPGRPVKFLCQEIEVSSRKILIYKNNECTLSAEWFLPIFGEILMYGQTFLNTDNPWGF